MALELKEVNGVFWLCDTESQFSLGIVRWSDERQQFWFYSSNVGKTTKVLREIADFLDSKTKEKTENERSISKNDA